MSHLYNPDFVTNRIVALKTIQLPELAFHSQLRDELTQQAVLLCPPKSWQIPTHTCTNFDALIIKKI